MMILKAFGEMSGLVIILLPIILCTFLSPALGESETLCQCETKTYSCNATQALCWNGTAFMNQCAGENITYYIDNLDYENTSESSCGLFNVSATKKMCEDLTGVNTSITCISSTLIFEVVDDLMGRTIMCTVDGGMQQVDITLNVTSCNGTDTTGACNMRQRHDESTTYATTSTVSSVMHPSAASTTAMHLSLLLLGALFAHTCEI